MLHQGRISADQPHVDYVLGELHRARGSASDVAFHFSHALHSLQQHATSKGAGIPMAQAEQIVQSIAGAAPGVLDQFSVQTERAIAEVSISQAKVLAWHWANYAPAHGGSDAGMIRTAVRYVTWLRNCCHNFALLHEIEEFHAHRAREARLARQTGDIFS